MKLINEDKVKIASEKVYPSLNQNWGHTTAFRKGVDFAESELKNMVIEFTKWKDEITHGEMFHNCLTNEINYFVGEDSFNIQELFEQYINKK